MWISRRICCGAKWRAARRTASCRTKKGLTKIDINLNGMAREWMQIVGKLAQNRPINRCRWCCVHSIIVLFGIPTISWFIVWIGFGQCRICRYAGGWNAHASTQIACEWRILFELRFSSYCWRYFFASSLKVLFIFHLGPLVLGMNGTMGKSFRPPNNRLN